MAPEMVKRKSHNPSPLDVWALGIVFYELLIEAGVRVMEDEELKRRIQKGFKFTIENNGK
jgi:serine/threonine protein kinase